MMASLSSASLHLDVGPQGSVALSIDGEVWYNSNANSSVDSVKLEFGHSSNTSGTDALGAFNATTFTWQSVSEKQLVMETTVREYGDFAVFDQRFLSTIAFKPDSERALHSDFPVFEEVKSHLSFATFNGPFARDVAVEIGQGLANCNAGRQGGPIVMFDASSVPMKTLVASQLTSFKGGDLYCGGNHGVKGTAHLSMGIKGTAVSVPAGYSISFIVVAGEGIAQTMEAW